MICRCIGTLTVIAGEFDELFIIVTSKCIGCRTCEGSVRGFSSGKSGLAIADPETFYRVSMSLKGVNISGDSLPWCEDACASVCPNGAMAVMVCHAGTLYWLQNCVVTRMVRWSGGASNSKQRRGTGVRADKMTNNATCATIVKTARRVWRLADPCADLCRS